MVEMTEWPIEELKLYALTIEQQGHRNLML
jgi:hypothetical protein